MADPGAVLAGRYRLVRQVGSGGMGVVWEAWDERLQRPVAVKQLKPQLGLSPAEADLAKNRAMREARITARLHHRNAVPVFDAVEHEGQPCLVMQFLPSVPLSVVLRESGPLGVREATEIGAQVASALAEAHELGIVHRDVKPGNVLLADDGTALISDFGISHALGDATLTSTGLVHGTPAYLAPEVARGADSSSASDVFSLGSTLYAAVEGGPPFGTDPNSIALLYKVASGELAPPRRAGVLAPLLMQMLHPDPAARPTMKEVASRLAAAEGGGTVPPTTRALPVVAGVPAVPAQDLAETTRNDRADEAATSVVPAPAVPASAAAPASVPLPPSPAPSEPYPPGRRRRSTWVLAVALLVGLAIVATALATGLLGRDGGVTGGDATTTGVPTATTPTAPSRRGTSASRTPSTSTTASSPRSSSSSSSSSSSPSRTTTTPSSSPTPAPSPTAPTSTAGTPTGGTPTAAQLEGAVTGYYALVPGSTDQAWPRLTASYQRTHGGGRQAYDRFWGQVDRVSVSDVEAAPPTRVVATITYRRGGSVAVERTSYRLVEENGILKIADSDVISGA